MELIKESMYFLAVQKEFHSETLSTESTGIGQEHVKGSGEMPLRNKTY